MCLATSPMCVGLIHNTSHSHLVFTKRKEKITYNLNRFILCQAGIFSGTLMTQNSFPFFLPPNLTSTLIIQAVYMCICVCIHTRAVLCVSEGQLGFHSFFKKWKFYFKRLKIFFSIVTLCVCRRFLCISALTECVLDTLISSYLSCFKKEKYFCKVLFFILYHLLLIRLSSLPSESEFESWLQNFRFKQWVKSETLTLFFFSNFASWRFDSMVLGQTVKGNLRCKKIPQLLNCLIIRKVGPQMINWIVFILHAPN